MEIKDLNKIIFTVGRKAPNGSVNLLGTCFLLNKVGLFATAAHVPNNIEKDLVIFMSENSDLRNYQDTSNNKGNFYIATIIKIDPICDVCILKTDFNQFSNIQIGGSDDINVSEGVGIVGFPHCVDGRSILTFQSTSIGAKILLESSGLKNKHLVLNIQTRPGQSGSPIFRLSDSKLIGMLIGSYAPLGGGGISLGGVDPHTLHQTSYAISSEYINRIM